MSGYAITVENLTKKFKNIMALNNVSLAIEKGKIYGFIGNNGAGKTTLMRILAGLTEPTSGSFTLLGKQKTKEVEEARRKMGFLIENPVYYEELNVWQNLKIQGILGDVRSHDMMDDILEKVGLFTAKKRKLKNCSLGMKQRYGLAAAILGNPEVLVLDEPVNGLDPSGIIEIRNLLLEMNREHGTTLFISSHILSELYQIATDYIFIDYGQIIHQINHESLTLQIGNRNLEQYFMGLLENKHDK